MITKKLNYVLIIIGCAMLLAYWSCRQHHIYPSLQNLTSSQKAIMKNLFSEVRSYCVGRYLIDVPVSFTRYKLSERMEDNLWEINISRPDDSHKTYILTKKMYHPAFLQFIQRREKELGVKKPLILIICHF
jgi:hypothetical protein